MPEIYIPNEVTKGFKAISELSHSDVDKIGEYLKTANPSLDPNEFLSGLESFLRKRLNNSSAIDIVGAISSFIDLLKNDSSEIVAKNLVNSLNELHENITTNINLDNLRDNIKGILDYSHSLEYSIKAYRLIRENYKNYSNSKIVSDIRIIFDKEIESKKRKAVIIHNLHIKYKTSTKNKDFFVALDSEDLFSLQKIIQRAIDKEKIIREDYKDLELL